MYKKKPYPMKTETKTLPAQELVDDEYPCAQIGVGLDMKMSENFQTTGCWVSVKLPCASSDDMIAEAHHTALRIAEEHLTSAGEVATEVLNGLIDQAR